MSAPSLTLDDVLRSIEILEESRIQYLNFDFISLTDIQRHLGLDDQSSLLPLIDELNREKRIMHIIKEDDEIQVKSRIGSLIFNLFKLKTRWSGDQNEPKNAVVCTADLKYIRYEKERPIRNIPLQDILNDNEIRESLEYNNDRSTHDIILRNFVTDLEEQKPNISNFQLNTTRKILHNLKEKRKDKGLGIVADTGTGKTFSYQLPLILWILHKKFRVWEKLKNEGKNIPRGICSAILLFPRNVLNQNQMSDWSQIEGIANNVITRDGVQDADFLKLMKVKHVGDYGQKISSNLERYYMYDKIDVIFTNTDSLKKRLYNPICHSTYKWGIDLILADEIHLSDGLSGAYSSGLFKRLNNLLQEYNKIPFFVGMSATINTPEKHCKKLFGLSQDVEIVNDLEDQKMHAFVEHHIALKPRPGVHPTGMFIDAISCTIHNRRRLNHSRTEADIKANNGLYLRNRPKTISFIQSRGQVFSKKDQMNDLEIWRFHTKQVRDNSEFDRQYIARYNPREEQMCNDCKSVGCLADTCLDYQNGNCWFFSENNAQTAWADPDRNGGSRIQYPIDNIRSKAMTGKRYKDNESNEDKPDEIFSEIGQTFRYNYEQLTGLLPYHTEIDNIFATSVFQVGVDFGNVQEVTNAGSLRSAASYKQQAGRGARSGSRDVGRFYPGLVVLSVVESDPISNFYFKHFDRLVFPELSPLKLETANPDVIKLQCFASIFDYLAMNEQVDLINIIKRRDSNNQQASQNIIDEYNRAKNILDDDRDTIKQFLQKFCSNILNSEARRDEIIERCIVEASNLIDRLSRNITLDNEEKSIAEWIANASRNETRASTMQTLRENITEPAQRIGENNQRKDIALDEIQRVFDELSGKEYLSSKKDQIENCLKELRDSL